MMWWLMITVSTLVVLGVRYANAETAAVGSHVEERERTSERDGGDVGARELARWRQKVTHVPAADAPRCRILSPRDSRLLAIATPFNVAVQVEGAMSREYTMRVQVADHVAEGRAKEATTVFRVDGLWRAQVSISIILYTASEDETHRSRVCIDEVELNLDTPMMKIFHPSSQDPVVVTPNCPLIVNFGLVLCNSGVPDCYANFEGDQFAGVNMYVNNHLHSRLNSSRVEIANLREVLQEGGEVFEGKRNEVSIVLVVLNVDGVEMLGLHAGLKAGVIFRDEIAATACHQYLSDPLHSFGNNSKVLTRNSFSSEHLNELHALNSNFDDPWDDKEGDVPLSCRGVEETRFLSVNMSEGNESGTCEVVMTPGNVDHEQAIIAYTFVTVDPTDLIFQVKLWRKFCKEHVKFVAVLNMDPLHQEFLRGVPRLRAVCQSLGVELDFLSLPCDRALRTSSGYHWLSSSLCHAVAMDWIWSRRVLRHHRKDVVLLLHSDVFPWRHFSVADLMRDDCAIVGRRWKKCHEENSKPPIEKDEEIGKNKVKEDEDEERMRREREFRCYWHMDSDIMLFNLSSMPAPSLLSFLPGATSPMKPHEHEADNTSAFDTIDAFFRHSETDKSPPFIDPTFDVPALNRFDPSSQTFELDTGGFSFLYLLLFQADSNAAPARMNMPVAALDGVLQMSWDREGREGKHVFFDRPRLTAAGLTRMYHQHPARRSKEELARLREDTACGRRVCWLRNTGRKFNHTCKSLLESGMRLSRGLRDFCEEMRREGEEEEEVNFGVNTISSFIHNRCGSGWCHCEGYGRACMSESHASEANYLNMLSEFVYVVLQSVYGSECVDCAVRDEVGKFGFEFRQTFAL